MGWRRKAATTAGRARYVAGQAVRSAWYTAQMQAARSRAEGFNRPGEPAFEPSRGRPDMAELRRAFFELFLQDRANIEAGLYPPPQELGLAGLPGALKAARAFQKDVQAVDQRRLARDGQELQRELQSGGDFLQRNANRYPDYYLQNFHYQTGGWFTDESAGLYDTQVEALFSGTADAMRRAALAEIAREMKGRDQRQVRLMDIACGNGRFLEKVLEVWPRLNASGLDLSPSYTEAARARLAPWRQVEIIQDAAEAMCVETGSQDIAVSIFLFHELPPRVRPRVLAEIFRILRPGGLFVLADSLQFGDREKLDGLLEYFPHGFHEPYYKDYLAWDLDGALTQAGFVKECGSLAFLTKVTAWRKSQL
ncbi:methyltransferase domain-containing protein [Hyphomonas sp. WL0036]|uniref:class I SAM-dependent methyltransferase n=1 Tax=Hyphomonas sediminis TaxID=2866160 RepID=UPI001C7E6806|nr:class I SAM-dependent methyltransferase [Hyphomonas sediminis]MBY9068456.1 methyltransferase domain-containing protein [Hyphomonas sediminis]